MRQRYYYRGSKHARRCCCDGACCVSSFDSSDVIYYDCGGAWTPICGCRGAGGVAVSGDCHGACSDAENSAAVGYAAVMNGQRVQRYWLKCQLPVAAPLQFLR